MKRGTVFMWVGMMTVICGTGLESRAGQSTQEPKILSLIVQQKNNWDKVKKKTLPTHSQLGAEFKDALAEAEWSLTVLVRPGSIVGHEYLLLTKEVVHGEELKAAEVYAVDFVPNARLGGDEEVIHMLLEGKDLPGKVRASWMGDPLLRTITQTYTSSWTVIPILSGIHPERIEELKREVERQREGESQYNSHLLNCESWINRLLSPFVTERQPSCEYSYGFTQLIRDFVETNSLCH